MKQKKLVIGVLIILLVTGASGVSASAPGTSKAQRHGIQERAQVVPAWQQVNSNGFGDQKTGEVTALEVFKGYLYAGTHHPVNPLLTYDGARIFRSPAGATWTPVTQPGFGDPHDSKPPAILDLAVFNGYLYASTGRGNAAQIWRSWDGLIWAPMVAAGFGDPDTVDITSLAVYNGWIYAGATNLVSGAQIWRSYSGSSNTWTKVAPGVPGMAATCVTGFAVFNGALYAALESAGLAQIWRSYDGNTWGTIVNNGFGDGNTTSIGGMAEFAGYLYVGAGNTVHGAQLWRTNNGVNWTQVITPGFGDPNNQKVDMVFVFQNQLYAGVKNEATGIELWRSTDGTLWERANQDGFGDSHNTDSNRSNATAEFLGQVYVGTSNIIDGGELWQMQQSYGVKLSPDDTAAGTAGTTMTYTMTISNSGGVTDTFSLASAGNNWTTLLSTPTITLASGTNDHFTVSVSIPVDALATMTDTVTITATSQGDVSKNDTAVLTTVSTGLPARIYLPVVVLNFTAVSMKGMRGVR